MTPLSSCIDEAINVRREDVTAPDPRVGKLTACTPLLSVVFVGTAGAERTPLSNSLHTTMLHFVITQSLRVFLEASISDRPFLLLPLPSCSPVFLLA